MLDNIVGLLDLNLRRVENLIGLYGPPARGRRSVQDTDILRAALVLLHAAMEDFLRSLLTWKVPLAGKEVVDEYPLTGSGRKRAEKFTLGALVQHRGKTVDELLSESIRDYLEEFSSFNDLGEVKRALVSCGMDRQTVDDHRYGDLAAMIARRHKIVHKADRNDIRGGQGNHTTASIGATALNNYLASVRSLRDFVQQHIRAANVA